MFRKFLVLLLAGCLCMTGACGKPKQTQAEIQAGKVKTFRDRQKKAAIGAYKDLVEKYPDSPHAAQARQKLQELGPPPAATPRPK